MLRPAHQRIAIKMKGSEKVINLSKSNVKLDALLLQQARIDYVINAITRDVTNRVHELVTGEALKADGHSTSSTRTSLDLLKQLSQMLEDRDIGFIRSTVAGLVRSVEPPPLLIEEIHLVLNSYCN